MSNITLLAIDLAKDVFQLCGADEGGNHVLRKRLIRSKLVETMANLPSCTIVMEACGGANHWCRTFSALGHTTKLISPQFVKPFVKGNKTDKNDSEAICEAASRPTMRFVSPKSIEQEDMQAIHRVRSRVVQERTALVNQLRGLLTEYGIVIAKSVNKVRQILPEILEDGENSLSHKGRQLFAELYEELLEKDKRIASYDDKINAIFKTNPMCQTISKIEGIGPITATAIAATIGDPKVFKNGRHFAAFLGLVPKQSSSGNKEKLLGISKRGDTYVRSLLVHGGRSVVRCVGTKEDTRSKWIKAIKERRGANRAAVAVANKNARIIWALLTHNEEYRRAV